jgi:flavin-dependent dehydrogenase
MANQEAGTKVDALIIGGGPAGLSTALMLKQRGCVV